MLLHDCCLQIQEWLMPSDTTRTRARAMHRKKSLNSPQNSTSKQSRVKRSKPQIEVKIVAREYPALDCATYVTILRAHETPSLICMRISGLSRSKTFAKCWRRRNRRSTELWVRSTKRPERYGTGESAPSAESPEFRNSTKISFVQAARGPLTTVPVA
jgi:hypothetical protein